MTNTIDKAVKHFDDLVSQTLRSFQVEEWDTTVYYRNSMNWAQQSRILDLSSQNKTSDALLETIVIRCLEKDGKPMFTQADKTTLKNSVDPEILLRIVAKMNSEEPSLEELEKN